jgi:type I restriction enzyme S subunit
MENQLPNNWVECSLGDILKLKNGFAFKSKNYLSEGIPVIRISEIKGQRIFIDKAVFVKKSDEYESYIVDNGDILIAMSGATTGKYGIYESGQKAYQNQRVGNLKLYSNELISKRFVYYLIGSLKEEIEEKAYGGAQPNISSKLIENTKFTLPPLKEQQRIAQKLDALFVRLDTIKKRLDTIPDLLKNFRQAVLNQAVTGKLTEEWRKGKKFHAWEETTIGNIFDVKTGATPKRGNESYYKNGTVPWLKSGQVKNEFIYEAEEFITEKALDDTNAKIFPIDTLLVAMYGEGKTRGQVGWMKIEAASNQAIAALVNEELSETTRYYVYYYCLSQYNEIRAQAEGGNQPNLNLSKIKNWEISIPSEKEQSEIVKRLDNLFSKADQTQQHYEVLNKYIENLPQSILQKAFKGELVEQLPTDGDAGDLLAEIQKLKEELTSKGKKKRK